MPTTFGGEPKFHYPQNKQLTI
ncbi:hypothetical protein [Staphylococcus aureus]